MSAAGTVSVVIPVRDGERYLGEAIESILVGSVVPAEVIVVDDGSTDGSAALASAFGGPVRCVSQGPLGLAPACNRGVAVSRGELVGFLDSDDLWTPAKLELQLEALARDPSLDAVLGHVVEFASPELDAAQLAGVGVRGEPAPARLRGTALIRRKLLDCVGPFEESIRVGDFIEWQARAQDAKARMALLDEVLLRRRIHMSNMGRVAPEPLDYVRVVRMIRERRGGALR